MRLPRAASQICLLLYSQSMVIMRCGLERFHLIISPSGAAVSDEFLEGMDQVMEYTMKEKGFDINTLSGAKAAQKFLENARVEDAFITEGPIDNAVDWHMGEARLDAMLKCVKARIQKMINKN